MGVSASIATSMRLSVLLLFTAPVAGRHPAVFSLGDKIPRLVSIHAESTGVTGVFEVRPVLEGSGRDADPCQRQLLGPSVITKMIALQRTGGEGGTELEVQTQKNTLCNRSKEFLLIHLDQIWAKPWAT